MNNPSAAAFYRAAHSIMKGAGENSTTIGEHIERYLRTGVGLQFAKDMQSAANTSDAWFQDAGGTLSDAFIASIAERNLFDGLIGMGATQLPDPRSAVQAYMGSSASATPEGIAKATSSLTINALTGEPDKVTALLVLTKELVDAEETAGLRLFRQELEKAVIKTMNETILQNLPSPSTVAATGDAVTSLEAALAVAPDSNGYVVAAIPSVTRSLAMASDGRMGINGGDFLPGVRVIPVESLTNNASQIVIPASRSSVWDGGILARNSGQADVELNTTPTADSATPTSSELVSMWQANLLGLLVERSFRIECADAPVAVV